MTPPPKCLYETLGVKTTATDAEIKKAYRALALERHPDKNPEDRDAAEEAFKELQHAYDVLSNPHERSWYDGHRDQILRGDDDGTGDGTGGSRKGHMGRATDINLASYLSSSVFKGFNSDAGGFYAVYADMFESLAREEDDFRATNESDDDDANMNGGGGRLPSFGGVNADWTSVRDFYRAWDSFSSHRSFAFADKWNLADTPRLFRREMERENRRLRTSARKEFNALVREVVAHAKKRDPRVARRKVEEEQARKEQERLKQERKLEQERQRQETMKEVRAAREQALEEDGEALDTILANIALDERIERRQKREKRRRARAKSDGRDDGDDEEKNAVEDGENDGEDGDERSRYNGAVDIDDGEDDNDVVIEDDTMENNASQQTNAEMEGQDGIDTASSEDMDDDDGVLAEELYCVACRKLLRTAGQMADHIRSKKHKLAEARLRRRLLKEEAQYEALQKHTDDPPEADNDDARDADNEGPVAISDDVEGGAVEDTGPVSNKSKKKKKKKRGMQQQVVSESLAEDNDNDKAQAKTHDDNDEEDEGQTAGGKALSKREKRKLREKRKREEDAAGGGGGNKGGDGGKAAGHACNKCGASFDSRTKLMRHVRDAGHALHVGR